MSEGKSSTDGYGYHEMSNQVIMTERSRQSREPSSDVQSLRAHLNKGDLYQMGTRLRSVKPTQAAKTKQNYAKVSSSFTNEKSKQSYDVFLGALHELMVDQPSEVLHSVAAEMLVVFKSQDLTIEEKKSKLCEIMGVGELKHYSKLYNLSMKIEDSEALKSAMNAVQFADDVAIVNIDDDDMDDGMHDEDPDDGLLYDIDTEHEHHMVLSDIPSVSSTVINPRITTRAWLQEQIEPFTSDDVIDDVLRVLGDVHNKTKYEEVEDELVTLIGYDGLEVIKILFDNRYSIVFGIAMEANPEVARAKYRNMVDFSHVIALYDGDTSKSDSTGFSSVTNQPSWSSSTLKVVDIQQLIDATKVNITKDCELPPGSILTQQKTHTEVHIPAMKAPPIANTEKTVLISDMPEWTHLAFSGMTSLNRIQSRIYPIAFEQNDNMLVCAPTGAGKTNCAMLTVARLLGLNRVPRDDPRATNLTGLSQLNSDSMNGDSVSVDPSACGLAIENFKAVYIAPMKSLVQEMVLNFSNRLGKYGITVRELSGDAQMSYQEILDTQIIVTTPEKWDIVTRKEGRSLLSLVKLVIIDEIHLLHDSRGPVLESIVARLIRHTEKTHQHIRLVGLSATLPNFVDVAMFLRVDINKGLFYFDNAYRPCPLNQQFLAVTPKRAYQRVQMQNQLMYEKLSEVINSNNQLIVFTHSRKDTINTAAYIRDNAVEDKTIEKFVEHGSARQLLLKDAAKTAEHPKLKELLEYGIGFHNAGMTRGDRTLVENLFAGQHLQALVSTATLAWGVNLPAHAVIIKGTQVYSPELSEWTELSIQDITQMVGRAGRPQYDSYGEGILITDEDHLQHYLNLLTVQLPIESQLLTRLLDSLNAEIVNGNITSSVDALHWLQYTFFYIRLLRNPSHYGVTRADIEQDDTLKPFLSNLIHSAFTVLDKSGLCQYEPKSGMIKNSELGRIASYYYISYKSIGTYQTSLNASITDVDILRIFATSSEFSQIQVREEEIQELARLMNLVPIPVRDAVDSPLCKVNVLLQCYISNISLRGFALSSDMVYITQSAGRLFRALFEMLVSRGWAAAALTVLSYCKMVSARMWETQCPLRQLPSVNAELVRRIEEKELPWEQLVLCDPDTLGALLNTPQQGNIIYKYIHRVPKLDVQGSAQPLSRSVIQISLDVLCDFQWTLDDHGSSIGAWVFVEDVDGEMILHSEYITLRQQHCSRSLHVSFIVPVFDPLPPHYFVRVTFDRWIGNTFVLPITLQNLQLPKPFPALTQVEDHAPLPLSVLKHPLFLKYMAQVYPHISVFNPIQTQTFPSIFTSDDNTLICSNNGSGKRVLADIAVLRFWLKLNDLRVKMQQQKSQKMGDGANDGSDSDDDEDIVFRTLIVTPYHHQAVALFNSPSTQAMCDIFNLDTCLLTGSPSDKNEVGDNELIFTSASHLDLITRDWRKQEWLHQVRLVVAHDIHMVGSEGTDNGNTLDSNVPFNGVIYENAMITLRTMVKELDMNLRFVAFGNSTTCGQYIGDWLNVANKNLFSFGPSSRSNPLKMVIKPTSMSLNTGVSAKSKKSTKSTKKGADAFSDIHTKADNSVVATNLNNAVVDKVFQDILLHSPQGPVIVYTQNQLECVSLSQELRKLGEQNRQMIISRRIKELSDYLDLEDDVYTRAGVISQDIRTTNTNTEDSASDAPIFLRCTDDMLLPHLDLGGDAMNDTVTELLAMGVGVLYPSMTALEKQAVLNLFKAGCIQLLIADNSLISSLSADRRVRANLVVIANNSYYDSNNSDFLSLSINNTVSALTQALVPRSPLTNHLYSSQLTVPATGILYVSQHKANYYRKFLLDGVSVESHYQHYLNGFINSGVSTRTLTSPQDCIHIFTFTYLFRRLKNNPNFYGLINDSKQTVNEFITKLVEDAIRALAEVKCIRVSNSDDDDDVDIEQLEITSDTELSPLNTGLICNHYNIDFETIKLFSDNLQPSMSLPSLLSLLSHSTEVEHSCLPHAGEYIQLQRLSRHLPYATPHTDSNIRNVYTFDTPAAKAFVLLQAYISKVPLLPSVMKEAKDLVTLVVRLANAIIDIASSQKWLRMTTEAMSVIQAFHSQCWPSSQSAPVSPLTQIPHFTTEMVALANTLGVEVVADVAEMSRKNRKALFGHLSSSQMQEVGIFVNNYPSVEVKVAVDTITAGVPSVIRILLDRTPEDDEEEDEFDEDCVMHDGRRECWWIVVAKGKDLCGIRKVFISDRKTTIPVRVNIEEEGEHELNIHILCDSYIGADLVFTQAVKVVADDE